MENSAIPFKSGLKISCICAQKSEASKFDLKSHPLTHMLLCIGAVLGFKWRAIGTWRLMLTETPSLLSTGHPGTPAQGRVSQYHPSSSSSSHNQWTTSTLLLFLLTLSKWDYSTNACFMVLGCYLPTCCGFLPLLPNVWKSLNSFFLSADTVYLAAYWHHIITHQKMPPRWHNDSSSMACCDSLDNMCGM